MRISVFMSGNRYRKMKRLAHSRTANKWQSRKRNGLALEPRSSPPHHTVKETTALCLGCGAGQEKGEAAMAKATFLLSHEAQEGELGGGGGGAKLKDSSV